jgi:hypothetical protein
LGVSASTVMRRSRPPAIGNDRKELINKCPILPEGADRGAAVDRCLDAVKNVRAAAMGDSLATLDAQTALDFISKISEQRQAVRSF